MATCTVNKEFIEEKIYDIALSTDDNVVIVNETISFSSMEKMLEFKEKVNNIFGVEGIDEIIITDDYSPRATIVRTNQIEELYDFENQSNEKDRENIDNEITEVLYHTMPRTEYVQDNFDEYNKYLNSLNREIEKIDLRMKNLIDEYMDGSISPERRAEIRKLKKQYSKIKQYLVDQTRNIEFVNRKVVEKLATAYKTLEELFSKFDITKDPHVVMTFNNILEETETFITEFGDKKYASDKAGGYIFSQDNDTIKDIRGKIHDLKVQFDRKMWKMQEEYLSTNPILVNDEKIRDILKNPQSDEYKTMFGGAAITDIGFLEFLGLNVDTSSTFDGVLGQLLVNEMDRIGQDNNNSSIEKKKKLYDIAQRFKKHGINLELEKDSEFLFEKDKFGNRTGNFQRPVTQEFVKKLMEFSQVVKSKKSEDVKTMKKMIREEFDYIDVFKLGFLYQDPKNINPFEKEFLECCRGIFKEITGDQTDFDKEYLTGHDKAYESLLESRFDSKTLESFKNRFMSSVIDFYYSYQKGDHVNHGDANPFMIMKAFDKKQQFKFKNKFTYRFNVLPLIPKKEEDYNKQYQKNFIEDRSEIGKLKRELYEFVYDVYTDFNLLYFGKNTLRSVNMEENSIDEAADAVKGIVRLDDVSSNLRKLKKNVLQWLEDQFWSENYFAKDDTKVSLNYSDKAEKKYRNIREALDRMSEEQRDDLAKRSGINKKDYIKGTEKTEEEKQQADSNYKSSIAKKMSLQGFSGNFYVTTMKALDLYYAQKTRNDIYPVAKMIQRQYESYTNNSGRQRENANKRMTDFITRSIQKLNLEDGNNPSDTKLSKITLLKNIVSKFDEIPFVNKFINNSLLKKMSEDEKILYEELKKAKEDINSTKDIKFTLNGIEYERQNGNCYKKINGCIYPISPTKINEFNEALAQYYDKRIASLGTDATLQNLVNLIRNLLLYKMLAGVSTSGLFNRIEGHLANSEIDATGYYWTPGNLNYVEKYFFGSWLNRYINRQGGKLLVRNEDKKHWKRLNIIEKMSQQTNIFQDMKNQFDKTIEGEQKGVLRHNLDLFQLSVGNPEFKNQMSMMLSVLIDTKIKDKNGVEHPIFDKNTGEFTCLDIVNNELVLKEEFNIDENQSWITFQSTIEKEIDGKKKSVISPSFEFAQKCKIMIKNVQGDYRQNTVLGYNNNMILSHLMMLKRWMPAKTMRGWSAGGTFDENTGKFMANYDVMWHKEAQTGVWFDTLTKTHSPITALMPVILSTTKLHKGILKTAVGTTASLYMIGKILKTKLGARPGEIEHNIGMLEESREIMKAWIMEILMAPARALKMDINLSRKSFFDKSAIDANGVWDKTKDKYVLEYGENTLGNFRACARTMATYFYLALLGTLVKLMFWDPEDGDDDDRRKIYNWIDNNLANILETTTATMFMIDNFEDKFDVSNMPIIRWTNDLGKFCSAVNEMNAEKALRYGNKVFMPIRFPMATDNFNPFESKFEYEKDTPGDRWVKNVKTDGEWGYEQEYKRARADIKAQYMKMWDKKKLPEDVIKEIEGMPTYKKLGIGSVYDLPKKEFDQLLTRSNVIPSRKMKQYKNRDYKFMRDVLLEEYENNDYLKNHTLRFIFGGYDNRLATYWQRNVSSDFADIKENPYFDED